MSNKKFLAIWIPVLCVVLALAVAVNVLTRVFRPYVDLYLGGGEMVVTKTEGSEDWESEYYALDYKDKKETAEAANALVEEIEGEGIVLLKNNGALPLSAPAKVTLLGRDAADPVYGGSGSGSVDPDKAVNLRDGLERAGYEINGAVYDALSAYAAYAEEMTALGASRVYDHPKGVITMDKGNSTYYIGEMPVEGYDGVISSFSAYDGAAIVVIGRVGGEGGDLTQDMKGWDDNYAPGQHQLELNQDEKDAIALAKKHFDTVIVLINASTTMELGELERDEGVDAIVWVGSPGQTGFYAVGDVLSGKVNPSGRTADLWAADFTRDPAFVNFGNFQYSNLSAANAVGDGYFVQYEEGIYVGYRYYETAAEEGFLDYGEAVVYPFGYGLSYTSFDWSVGGRELGDVDGTISVDVTVTNTGSAAGKDVVELYYSAPYTPGGIEKPSVVLGAFAKTDLLQPGESQTVTLTLDVEDMASYDYQNERAYVLEAGDYTLTLRTDSHRVKDGCEPVVYKVGRTVVYSGENHRASDAAPVTNQFDDLSARFSGAPAEGMAVNMSRADFAGTFPTAPTAADMAADEEVLAGFQPYDPAAHHDPEAEMPRLGEKNGLSLIDLRGLPYDDPSWELMLDQLSVKDMERLVLNGMYATVDLSSVGKPATVDFDGPAGINSYMTSLSCTAYPSEVVIASTFNVELVRRMGEMVGNESIANQVNGWYAPAMNLHRSPFGGRNFEYYSEDPLLSGAMGAACVSGAASKGLYCTIKHFAVNDQETNRVNGGGISVWANEQALRELYLKPFEYTVKHASAAVRYISDGEGTMSERELPACTAVMSSYNRLGATWAGGSAALMGRVLRDEWGFRGFAITDFDLYEFMYPDQAAAAGSDLILSTDAMKSLADTKSAAAVNNLRGACHNILYAVAHSHAMNGIVPGTMISYTAAPWEGWLAAANAAVGMLLAAGAAWVVFRVCKNRRDGG